MRMISWIWEGLSGVWKFLTRGSLWLVLVVIVAGCSGEGGFTGSPHGYSGTVNTIWADINGVPTIVPDGGSPMGYRNGQEEDMYTTYTDGFGTIATGRAAYVLGLARLCLMAPNTPLCTGDISP